MKILFVVDTYPPNVNGASIATHRIVTDLAKKGHQMYVVAPSTRFKNDLEQSGSVKIYRIRSIELLKHQKLRITPHVFLYRKNLKNIIETIKPDIININSPSFLGATAIYLSKKLQIPIVGTVHLMPENLFHQIYLPDMLEGTISNIIWKPYARLFNNLDVVISPTETAAKILKKSGLKRKVNIISNGIDLSTFRVDKDSAKYLVKKYKLPQVPIVLFVGRVDKEKELNILIQAAERLKGVVDFHVVISGKGKQLKEMTSLSKKLNVSDLITFTGFLPESDLAHIYNIADIFVMPGIAELQSLVTMEAMASGLPVVGANAVALPHLIKNGKNGYLFLPSDSSDLAKKLLVLLKDRRLREKMGKESLAEIQKHDINFVIHETEKIYMELIHPQKNNSDKKKIAGLQNNS